MAERLPYPSDLSDEQWALIEPLVPKVKSGGRPAEYERREIVNAILYVLRSGCAWRMMPHDLPYWESAYAYFRMWQADGTWERIEEAFRRKVRKAVGKKPTPSTGVIDRQCVKTSDQGGPRGYDSGKKVIGRKRHVLVDTMGLIWLVTAANVQDRDGARILLAKLERGFSRLKLIWADSAYNAHGLFAWLKVLRPRLGQVRLEIVGGIAGQKGFVVQPKRWVVERTLGWLNKCRRLSEDYERKPEHSEAMIRIASIQLMIRRLTLNYGSKHDLSSTLANFSRKRGGRVNWYGGQSDAVYPTRRGKRRTHDVCLPIQSSCLEARASTSLWSDPGSGSQHDYGRSACTGKGQ